MKKALKFLGFSLTLIVIMIIIISNLGVIVGGRSIEYIDNYKAFYLYEKDYKPFIDFGGFGTGGSGPFKKIWFSPGQKQKLLNRIDGDLINSVKNLIKKREGILKAYKFDSDFNSHTIYYNHEVYIYDVSNKADEEIYKQIDTKMELRNQLKYGYANTPEDSFGTHFEAWFDSNKKQDTLNKIKNDLDLYLIDFASKNTKKIKGYKISDDVKKVYLFYGEGFDLVEDRGAFNLNEIYISNIISLYQECNGGYENGKKYNWYGDVIEWVKK